MVCFVVLWAVVFTQMATGNDPVLGGKETAVATRAARAADKEVETTDPRELEIERRTDSAPIEEEAIESEPEVEAEPEVIEEAELFEAEAEPFEEETEPLVTSQS